MKYHHTSKCMALLLALALLLLAAAEDPPPLAAQESTAVFINEIHYEDSTDNEEGEAVEIAGPAGTDLAGWSLVL